MLPSTHTTTEQHCEESRSRSLEKNKGAEEVPSRLILLSFGRVRGTLLRRGVWAARQCTSSSKIMSPCTLLTLREELCTPGYPERREVTGEVTGPASRSGPLSLSFCLSDVYLPNLRFCVLSVAQGLALWLLYIILLNLPLNSSSFTIDSCYLPCTNRTGGKLYPTWELLSCRRLKTILRPRPGSLGYTG